VVFYGSPLNPTSLACGSTAVEAAQALKPGKEKKHRLEAPIQVVRVVGWISCVRTTTLSYLSASEMTYIVSSGALNSTHSTTTLWSDDATRKWSGSTRVRTGDWEYRHKVMVYVCACVVSSLCPLPFSSPATLRLPSITPASPTHAGLELQYGVNVIINT